MLIKIPTRISNRPTMSQVRMGIIVMITKVSAPWLGAVLSGITIKMQNVLVLLGWLRGEGQRDNNY